ncbi:MAG: FkbM family methyltransferase [Candidatus Lokiarchaeota archaeon]|nr:FkbM family methyltransferase [Candidatus Lokiarchaeota archaeon]
MKEICLPNGTTIYCIDELTALYVYDEIFVEKEYLKRGIEISNNDVIVDVGANIGLFSLFALTQALGLSIYAFEPIPQIFEVLEANLKPLESKIMLFNLGLGEEEKEIKFNYYPKVSGDSTAVPFDLERKTDLYVEHYKETICQDLPIARIVPKFLRKWVVRRGLQKFYSSESISCHILPLSKIIEKYNIQKIDLLKIDAENYEKHVIAGIEEHDWPKIQQIAMEVHQHIPEGENLLKELTEFLERKGFIIDYGDETRETILDVHMLYAIKKK